MSTDIISNPNEFSKLAIQYGPFFFSILFLIFIPKTLYGYIKKAKDAKEKMVYLRTYQIAFAFGIALVIASVVWWFIHFPLTYVFKGQICDLESYAKISSDSLFFKPVAIPFAGEEDLVQNVEFIIVQSSPFKRGQKFRLYFKKEGGEKKTLPLIYESEQDSEFEIKYIETKNNYEIISLTPKPVAKFPEPKLFSPQAVFGGFLFAEELKNGPAVSAESTLSFPPQAQNYEQYIELLQDEKTAVGIKIKILYSLKSLPDDIFKEIVETSTPKEPMVLTLLDLGRHSDKELAYLSNALLKRFDIETYMASQLLAADQVSRNKGETVLFRVEKDLAERVLSLIPPEDRTPRIRKLQDEVNAGEKTRVLYPTGSNTGDRYYIFVEWNPGTCVPECLAQKFSREILFTSLEKELASLKDQNSRWVYKEDKESALRFVEEIFACGAKAQFARIKSTTK
jgi:hypothetical protein